MSTQITLKADKSAVINYFYGTYNDHTSTEHEYYDDSYNWYGMVFGFTFPSQYNHRKLDYFDYASRSSPISVSAYIKNKSSSQTCSPYISWLTEPFSESTVTRDNISATGSCDAVDTTSWGYNIIGFEIPGTDVSSKRSRFLNIINNGCFLQTHTPQYGYFATSHDSTMKPFIYIYVEDEDNGFNLYPGSHYSGYVPKYAATTFTWSEEVDSFSYVMPTVASREFRWRYTGATTYNTVACSSASCTIPANTFTQDNVQWCVAVTDSFGATVTTSWYDVYTNEDTSTAIADSPKNSIIENSKANTFTWTHVISTGTLPTRSDLQYSTDGSTWSTLATVTGSATSTVIPANTLGSGTRYWRVRTYNTDNTAGAWSSAASFICLGPPNLTGVSADSTPRPTISWQSSDMQGYEIMIDSWDSGVQYGIKYSYVAPFYLTNGSHTIKVRAVGQYGIWCDWVSITVITSNTAGNAITLTATEDEGVVSLSWVTSGYDSYIVYRDDVPIAKTTGTQYVDNNVLGTHNYQIRGIYSSSMNYGLSTSVSVTTSVTETVISKVGLGSWIKLDLSSVSMDTVYYSFKSSSVTAHHTGQNLPSAELSRYKDTVVRCDAAFTEDNIESATALEALLGSVVCLKTKKGQCVIGLLNSLSREDSTFFRSYEFSITATEYDEEITI